MRSGSGCGIKHYGVHQSPVGAPTSIVLPDPYLCLVLADDNIQIGLLIVAAPGAAVHDLINAIARLFVVEMNMSGDECLDMVLL